MKDHGLLVPVVGRLLAILPLKTTHFFGIDPSILARTTGPSFALGPVVHPGEVDAEQLPCVAACGQLRVTAAAQPVGVQVHRPCPVLLVPSHLLGAPMITASSPDRWSCPSPGGSSVGLAAADEVGVLAPGAQAHHDRWCAGPGSDLRQDGGEQASVGVGLDGQEHAGSGAGLAAGAPARGVEGLQRWAGVGEQQAPGVGERHRAGGAREQCGTQVGLELADGAGQHWSGDAQVLGGPGEAGLGGHGEEVAHRPGLEHRSGPAHTSQRDLHGLGIRAVGVRVAAGLVLHAGAGDAQAGDDGARQALFSLSGSAVVEQWPTGTERAPIMDRPVSNQRAGQ